jgi:hypothetical protein
VTAVDAAPPEAAPALPNGVGVHTLESGADNNRSDTMVVPTVTAHDGLVEPLPVPTVLFERDEEPSAERPIAYRERVFAVPSGTTRERAEALARQSFAAIKRALNARPRGRFVSIAVFDEEFSSRPSQPPLVVLEWKDWRGEPTVQYPESLPPPPAEPVAVVEKAPEAPPTAPVPSAETSKRPRVQTESDISMVEVLPPPVPPAAIPSASDISMVEVMPPPVPTAPAPAEPARPAPTPPASAAARGQESKSKKDKKRRRNRTSSESNISTTTALQATKSSTQTPAERDAPTVVVPVFKAPETPAAAPVVATPAVAAKEAPAPAAPTPAVVAAPPVAAVAAVKEAAPAPVVEAAPAPVVEATPASAKAVEPAAAPSPVVVEVAPVAATPVEPPVVATPAPAEATAPLETKLEAPAAEVKPEAPVAEVKPEAPAAEVKPDVPAVETKPEAPAADVKPEAPAAEVKPEAPAAEVKPVVIPTRSSALTAKRRRGKELVGDLFDALMDLSFTQSPEDACSFAARVLHEYVVCDGVSVAVYDIDHDEFVVSASEGVSIVGNRDKASRGSRTLAVRKRSAVNLKRGDTAEGLADFLAGGPSVFVPAFHRDRLFAMATLQRMPGAPAFETDEEDGASYVASQLGEALAGHSQRTAAKQLDEESRKGAPKRR